MNGTNESVIPSTEEATLRLDQLLTKRFPEHSRAYFQGLIDQGSVRLNGNKVKKRQQVTPNDKIEITFTNRPDSQLKPEAISLDILHEDEALIVINKPAGLVVHPGAGNWSGTLVNGLIHHCKKLAGDPLRPGIIHRLDKETSGLLVAAKTDKAKEKLMAQFMARKVKKRYLAICIGNPGNLTIDKPLGRHPVNRIKQAVIEGGKEAITHVRSLTSANGLSLLEIDLKTGRTHQIRVHLRAIGFPILGDSLYGDPTINQKWSAPHQMLHAAHLSFHHPLTDLPLTFTASPHLHFKALQDKCDLTYRG